MRGACKKKALKKLEARQADWAKTVSDPAIKPGSFHKPGSMNGRKG